MTACKMFLYLVITVCLTFGAAGSVLDAAEDSSAPTDMRDIRTGHVIPDEGYCDQPYVVITKDGNWLCLLTTAGGHEGAANSHVVSTISADQGRTWSELVELEPVDGPPSAIPFRSSLTAGACMPSMTTTATTSSARRAAIAWVGSSTSTRMTTAERGPRSVTVCPCG